jgi:hypothetical protein
MLLNAESIRDRFDSKKKSQTTGKVQQHPNVHVAHARLAGEGLLSFFNTVSIHPWQLQHVTRALQHLAGGAPRRLWQKHGRQQSG